MVEGKFAQAYFRIGLISYSYIEINVIYRSHKWKIFHTDNTVLSQQTSLYDAELRTSLGFTQSGNATDDSFSLKALRSYTVKALLHNTQSKYRQEQCRWNANVRRQSSECGRSFASCSLHVSCVRDSKLEIVT